MTKLHRLAFTASQKRSMSAAFGVIACAPLLLAGVAGATPAPAQDMPESPSLPTEVISDIANNAQATETSNAKEPSKPSISTRTGFQRGPEGIDVSKWQRPGGAALNWQKVAASGQKFAFIKATDPTEGDSAYFIEDSVAAAKAGLLIGSYHKAHPDQSATEQADAYAALLAKRDAAAPNAKTLPPVLDIELDNGLKPAALQDWTKQFLQRIEAKTGETPIIYTYRSFWKVQMGNSTDFTNYPLWLAAYQDNAPTDIPGGWTSMLFWQRSSTGKVSGIPTQVDQDVFNGSAEELTALADAH
ncbi:glycoside hydrolase family 25 protein [Corynebacterium lactis]|uniref:Hydrolase n=1 Tax=Corynebacterium lactis RW2-5 TaxID=1408189 RepID=A0A0K2GXE4_9CORY|nr:GH25 family lysozyme [Corynebacterium lactis]ALA66462.1 hydrolase [Corynebacterium lactis RW2-5]